MAMHQVAIFLERSKGKREKGRDPLKDPCPDGGAGVPYAPSGKVHALLAPLQELYLKIR